MSDPTKPEEQTEFDVTNSGEVEPVLADDDATDVLAPATPETDADDAEAEGETVLGDEDGEDETEDDEG